MILHQRVYSVHLSDERIQFTNQRTVKGLLMAESEHSVSVISTWFNDRYWVKRTCT